MDNLVFVLIQFFVFVPSLICLFIWALKKDEHNRQKFYAKFFNHLDYELLVHHATITRHINSLSFSNDEIEKNE